jgi:hypothetical protein
MPKPATIAVPLTLVAALLLAAPASAAETDRALLSTFCDAANIKGSTCKRAKAYPNAGRRACDVALREERYSGKFIGSGNPLLVVFYDSGCEAHTTDDGGAVVFGQIDGKYSFRSFQPGVLGSECVTLPNNDRQDLLVCLTGHMGQGILESRVAQMAFKEDAAKRISMSLDVLLSAEDAEGAFGSNVVTCKDDRFKVFNVLKLSVGPRPNTIAVEATYADAATIEIACGKGFPKRQDAIGELTPGDVYVPDGHQKSGKLIIDLATRKVTPQ